jgi:hypothetical protein
MLAEIVKARLFLAVSVFVFAMVLLAPLSANAQVTIYHVKVTVANDQVATYCDVLTNCATTGGINVWNIPSGGIELSPGETLVLTQTGSIPVGASIGSNFDTSERIKPAPAVPQTRDCFAASGNGCTVQIFIDTGSGFGAPVYSSSAGNEINAFNLDNGSPLFQEARPWSAPVVSAPSYTLQLGYADNVHGPCPASGCTPSPFANANNFLGAGLPGPAGTCPSAPCWDAGALLITGVFVPPPILVGRMTGGGSVFTRAGVRVTHGFELHCDPEDEPNNLEINWDGGNNFHLTSLTAVTCINDPAIDPPPPDAGFDTYRATGVGTCNGLPATIAFVLTDAGEPGTLDTASFVIAGGCSLVVTNNLDHGNQQAHKK